VRVLIDYRPALRERTGAGEYTHQLVRSLTRENRPPELEIALFSSSWKDRLTEGGELGNVALVDRRVPVRLLNLMWHRLSWPPADMLAGRSVDVAHSSHPLLMPARRAARVVTIHDLNFLDHPERTRGEVRRDYPALVRAHAHRADRILVSSTFTAGEVERKLGIPGDRIVVATPGAPDWAPRPTAPANGYLLFVGTLEPRKNIGGLLDAYEHLIGHTAEAGRRLPELVLAGKATDASGPWLDRIGRPPLKGRVRHLGYVEASTRRALYEGARLLVLPSFEEGFGLPALEAMTIGVPVIAARRGALPEVVGDGGLLIDPDQPTDIAAAIARMLDEPQAASACAARGLARSRAFRWDVSAWKVYDMYRQAVEHHAHRR
jgi:glycosyltransferase involved in cell wall biosynthesis